MYYLYIYIDHIFFYRKMKKYYSIVRPIVLVYVAIDSLLIIMLTFIVISVSFKIYNYLE